MAEIIGTYIESSDIGLNKQLLNFSNQFRLIFKEKKLELKECESKRFYHEHISNITAIIGANGSGKSSILELISIGNCHRKNRFKSWVYFNLFHIEDDLFYYEGTTDLLLMITDDVPYKNSNMVEVFLQKNANGFSIIDRVAMNRYNKVNISYQVMHPNVSWYSKSNYHRSDITGSLFNRYFSTISTPKNIIDFMTNDSNFSKRRNHADFLLVHSLDYHKQKSYDILCKIYLTNEERTTQLKDAVYRQLNDETSRSRNIDQRYDEDERYKQLMAIRYKQLTEDFKRRKQDNNLKNVKLSYILRLFEKEIIQIIMGSLKRGNSEKSREFGDTVTEQISSYRQEKYPTLDVHDFSDQSVSKRIEFCVDSLDTFLRQKDNSWSYRNLLSILMKLNEKSYVDKNTIILNTLDMDEQDNELVDFVTKNSIPLFNMMFDNLSDGELVYLSTYSNIYSRLMMDELDSLILILDEPDLNLHPEWSRLFISRLISLINDSEIENVQVIFSTHSPYLITDIRRSDAYSINFNYETEKEIKNVEKSFAANIYELLASSFFLKHPIGDFARKKIESLNNDNNLEREMIIGEIDDRLLKNLIRDSLTKDELSIIDSLVEDHD